MDLHETARALAAEIERVEKLPMFSKAAALPALIRLQMQLNALVLAELDRICAAWAPLARPASADTKPKGKP